MSTERLNALPAGTEFDGYRFGAVLGAGGFGITYRATELLLDRTVAIKEFLPSGMAQRAADGLAVAPIGATEAEDFAWGMERFRAEAQTLVALRHPNIVSVLRYFETNNTGYLVMEFVEGKTLGEVLGPGQTLEEAEARELLDPLLDGLQAVHDKGFLHRDIKPANIFIRADGSPVLIDFGAARLAIGRHSKSLTAIISGGYAPYEQYDADGAQGVWTDIYALGGVLYRCVTGLRPPEAPSRVSAMVRGDPDPLMPVAEAAKVECSRAFLAAIDRALAVRETDRPQTIAAFRAMLDGAAPGDGERAGGETLFTGSTAPPVVPPPSGGAPSTPPASAPPPARRWGAWRVVAPLVLLVVAGAAAGTWALIGGAGGGRCRQIADDARAAIDRGDSATADQRIADAVAAACAEDQVAALRRDLAVLVARKTQIAEARRRRVAAAKPKRPEADATRAQRDRERKMAEAEAERKRAEAERQRMAEEERRRAARVERKKPEERRPAAPAPRTDAADAARKKEEAEEARRKAEEARRKAEAQAARKRQEAERKERQEAERKEADAANQRAVVNAIHSRAAACQETPAGQQFGVSTYCASSVLAPRGPRNYGPLNAFKGPAVAWVEGKPDAGIGQWLAITYPKPVCFRTLIVRNGYGRNDAIFKGNNRVRRARITTGDGLSTVITFPDRNADHRIPLPRAVDTRWIMLTILDVYRGTRWNDTAIGYFVPDLEELNHTAGACK